MGICVVLCMEVTEVAYLLEIIVSSVPNQVGQFRTTLNTAYSSCYNRNGWEITHRIDALIELLSTHLHKCSSAISPLWGTAHYLE